MNNGMEAISLFSGAGGLDIGFMQAGFSIVAAMELDKHACATYRANIGNHIYEASVDTYHDVLAQYRNRVACVFGGPPCQGFSVAGKMDVKDPRSALVFTFLDAVQFLNPDVWVMENVASLLRLTKFKQIRERLLSKISDMGCQYEWIILKASDFGVPQARERAFLFAWREGKALSTPLTDHVIHYKKTPVTVREALLALGKPGTHTNSTVIKANIVPCRNPILRAYPYAGMLFNGQGRPINPDGYAPTLPASMGGNRTPIIDEVRLYKEEPGWVEEYHAHLIAGGSVASAGAVPNTIRRITVEEAVCLQTFPSDWQFCGPQSAVLRQIGNAVPPGLARAVGFAAKDIYLKNI